MSEDANLRIFGYPIRDWIFLLALLGVGIGGGSLATGSVQASEAIESRISVMSSELRDMSESIDRSTSLSIINARRLDNLEDDIETRIDSLHRTMLKGLGNLDGYFKGRLDQIGGR